MNGIRKPFSLLLITLFLFCMSGCSFFGGRVPDAIISTAKSYGLRQVAERTDLIRITAKLDAAGSGYYVAKDAKEATKYYQSLFNTRKKLPDVDANDFIMLVVREKGDVVYHTSSVYSVEFKNEDDAKEVYEKYTADFKSYKRAEEVKQGEEKNYSYSILYEKSSVSLTIRGAYLEGKSVTYIQANSYKKETNAFAEHFCNKMGYISPMTLVEE